MFNSKRWKELVEIEDNFTWEEYQGDYHMDKLWNEMLGLILTNEEDFQDFLRYMEEEMTENEYSTLSEISDDIARRKPSREFVKQYKKLAEKYPEETKKYNVDTFISDAESIVEYYLDPLEK